MTDTRAVLREIPVLQADPGPLVTAATDPVALFTEWLAEALDVGVLEPHAMTVSTCSADGAPDARVLILKDLEDQTWWFASGTQSSKAQQLRSNPQAALTFYWPRLGRQVRVRGPVVEASAERSAADFAERGATSRAVAMTGRQSQSLAHPDDVGFEVERLLKDPPAGAAWTLWGVRAEQVEFWQAAASRQHSRLLFTRTTSGWDRGWLWP